MPNARRSFLQLQLLVVILCGAVISQEKTFATDANPKYRNPNLAIEDRVADLLSRMTLEQKVQQLAGGGEGQTEVIDPTGTYTSETARATLTRWWDPDMPFTPKKSAILRDGIQRFLKEKTRLGIPQLFMGESLHGFM